MSAVTSTNALAKDSTLQDVADAISTMGATSVGNLSALTTTDKTSLVGAVNELRSGLISVKTYTHVFSEGIPAGISNASILKSTGIPNGSKCISVRAPYDIAGVLQLLFNVVESSKEYFIVVNNLGNAITTSVRIFIDYI